ncbi:MAG: hypothetical protein QXK47_05930 [Candidatus Bathyarchaeia archaeon]
MKRWLFIEFDDDQKRTVQTVQIVPDDVLKGLSGEGDEVVRKSRDVRKQARRIRSFAEEFMMRQKRELEKVPQTVQLKVVRTEPRLGQKYNLQSGHGVYTCIPSVREKTAVLVRDVLSKKVSPNRFLERLKWLCEEAMECSPVKT